MRRGFSTPLVIAIMAFAVVSFLFLIDTAMNPDGSKKTSTNKNTNPVACTLEAKICPDGSYLGRSGPNCEFAKCPGTNNNTETSASQKESTDEIDPTNSNVHIYTSYKLGVRFKYWSSADEKNSVLENGNKIYVYYYNGDTPIEPMDGQWVEVLTKQVSQNLAEAVKEDFLLGVNQTDCFVTTPSSDTPAPGSIAVIDFPHTGDLGDPSWDNRDKCPSNYTVTNGILYFLTDGTHLTKYAFFSIGQYGIKGTSDQIMWQDTLTFLD